MEYYKKYIKQYKLLFKEFKTNVNEFTSQSRDKTKALQVLHNDYNQKLRKNEQDLINADIGRFWIIFDELFAIDSMLSPSDAFYRTFDTLKTECDDNKISLIVENRALFNIKKFIAQQLDEIKAIQTGEIKKRNNYWIGTESTEFVQLMYGLIESGRLEKKNKTKMIKDIAYFLGIDLSSHWQSNKTKTVHDRNDDYVPSIFHESIQGWKKYAENQLNKKTKK